MWVLKSQFLIGKVLPEAIQNAEKKVETAKASVSQFLIGKVLLTSDVAQIIKGVNPLKSQFLIGKV